MSEIFSEKVITNRRTYFFDVKETKEGARYLVIGELTQMGGDLERHRVMVFEESLESFVEAMDKAVDFILYGDEGEQRGQGGESDNAVEQQHDRSDLRDMLRRIERKVDDIRGHFK